MKPRAWMTHIGLAHGPYYRKHVAYNSALGFFNYTTTTMRRYYRWRWES